MKASSRCRGCTTSTLKTCLWHPAPCLRAMLGELGGAGRGTESHRIEGSVGGATGAGGAERKGGISPSLSYFWCAKTLNRQNFKNSIKRTIVSVLVLFTSLCLTSNCFTFPKLSGGITACSGGYSTNTHISVRADVRDELPRS